MKTFIISCLLLTASPVLFASDQTTVKGELLDLACYMTHGAKGPKHKECAEKCVKGGQPMGILTDNGDVYLLVENHNNPDPYAEAKNHAAETIEVSGSLNERGGVKAITVESVKKS